MEQQNCTLLLLLLLAYMGNLVASLTYPARTKAIDTFEDLTKLQDDTLVVTPIYSQRIVEIMKEATDPILKVIIQHLYLKYFAPSVPIR